MADYPAAHSMDTEWFAVDADGNVAIFDTGEDGALPLAAGTGRGPDAGTVDEALVHAAMVARRIVRGDARQSAADVEEAARAQEQRPRDRVLVAVDGAPAAYRDEPRPEIGAEELLPASRFAVLREKDPRIAVSLAPLRADDIRALVETGRVVALIGEGSLADGVEEGAELDVYRFDREHADEPGAYVRRSSPEAPLRLDDLPAPARAEVGKLRLPLRFADSEALHLGDHIADQDAALYGDWTLRGFDPPGGVAAAAARAAPARPSRPGLAILVLLVLGLVAWLVARR